MSRSELAFISISLCCAEGEAARMETVKNLNEWNTEMCYENYLESVRE